jgi:hypothetical protein
VIFGEFEQDRGQGRGILLADEGLQGSAEVLRAHAEYEFRFDDEVASLDDPSLFAAHGPGMWSTRGSRGVHSGTRHVLEEVPPAPI